MNDAHLAERVARDHVRRHGRMALPMLVERVEADGETGDWLSAEAWRAIAEAVSRILTCCWSMPYSRVTEP